MFKKRDKNGKMLSPSRLVNNAMTSIELEAMEDIRTNLHKIQTSYPSYFKFSSTYVQNNSAMNMLTSFLEAGNKHPNKAIFTSWVLMCRKSQYKKIDFPRKHTLLNCILYHNPDDIEVYNETETKFVEEAYSILSQALLKMFGCEHTSTSKALKYYTEAIIRNMPLGVRLTDKELKKCREHLKDLTVIYQLQNKKLEFLGNLDKLKSTPDAETK